MNKSSQNRNGKTSRERGVALIAALITLLLIAAITAGMIILSTTETNISSNFRDEQLAFFSAKAGIEEARDRMRKTAANTLRTAGTLPTTLPGSGTTGVLYILNPANGETVTPGSSSPSTYADDEICKETTTVACSTGKPNYPSRSSGWYTTVSASPTYAAAPVMPWKWTRITLKQNNGLAPYYTNGNSANAGYVCWNGTNEFASAAACASPNLPVYVLTTLAVTPGGSRRMVQTEIAEDSLNFQTPSALLVDGTGDTFGPGASNQWGASGIDQPGCGVTTTGPSVNAIGVPDNSDQTAITNAITALPGNRSAQYPGVSPSPSVANVSSTMPPSLQTVSGLQNLVTTIKNNVTQPILTACPHL
jgi:Tfp pilus assembly protein PilX